MFSLSEEARLRTLVLLATKESVSKKTPPLMGRTSSAIQSHGDHGPLKMQQKAQMTLASVLLGKRKKANPPPPPTKKRVRRRSARTSVRTLGL